MRSMSMAFFVVGRSAGCALGVQLAVVARSALAIRQFSKNMFSA